MDAGVLGRRVRVRASDDRCFVKTLRRTQHNPVAFSESLVNLGSCSSQPTNDIVFIVQVFQLVASTTSISLPATSLQAVHLSCVDLLSACSATSIQAKVMYYFDRMF